MNQFGIQGMFCLRISNDTITCGCTHLTSFSLSKDKAIPKANTLTEILAATNNKNLLVYQRYGSRFKHICNIPLFI